MSILPPGDLILPMQKTWDEQSIVPGFSVGCTKVNPRLCRGQNRALADNKEIEEMAWLS